ncbi:MAG TPA: anion transporter [Stellaceae bacterium]|jgi:Na+/H+ antiporter NhaD/arsenite permease-like protein|nr:anion transporter [Stellaceae bacterium]
MNPTAVAAIAVFAATYIALAIGKLPPLRIDRAGIALVGGSLMLAIGAMNVAEVTQAIDFNTLALLLGMMIVVANLRLSGFFRLVNAWIVTRAHHPMMLLVAVTFVSGLFSAFLLNDAICLVMTPLVIDIVQRLRRDPAPYLLALAMAANIGSAATITGNPQNILVGSFSQIPYGVFAAHLSPPAAVGLILTVVLIALTYRREFGRGETLQASPMRAHLHRPLAAKSVLVVLAMMAAFFAGQPPAKVALIGGGILLLTRMVRSERVYREIDWPLLVMFAGLFVVVAGFEKALLTPERVAAIGGLGLDSMPVLGVATAALSNLVSNVPAVLVIKPFLAKAHDAQHAWLVVAMASTFAGNLTVLGSVANLIVVQQARAHGVTIGFWQYLRVGAPLTVLTIAFGLWWL